MRERAVCFEAQPVSCGWWFSMAKWSVSESLLRAKSCERRGDFDAARQIYQGIVTAFPNNQRARVALEALDRRQESDRDPPQQVLNQLLVLFQAGQVGVLAQEAARLQARFPQSATLCTLVGVASIRLGRAPEAEAAFRRACAIEPGSADHWNNLGNVLREQGRLAEASDSFHRALDLRPEFAEAQNNLGNVERAQGDFDRAETSYRRATVLRPGYPESWINLGSVQAEQGNHAGAIDSYGRALALRAHDAVAQNNLGNALAAVGDFTGAERAFLRALEIDPNLAYTHRHLSALLHYTPDTPHLAQMQALYDAPAISRADRCHLCFALAKACEDLGDLSAAFAFLQEGNALRKTLLNYDIAQDRALFDRLRAAAPALIAAPFAPGPPAVPVPVFVLGLPRSGTSLIEQILSSHAEVRGAGEMPDLARHGGALAAGEVAPTPDALATFRSRYLAALAARGNGGGYVIDKTPHNFRLIALIAKALPEARIVHVRRKPRAVCWSNFRQYFSADALGYSYDLQDVVAYHALYEDLMAVWAQAFPGRIIDVNYDRLTDAPEPETRRLVADLGLPWDDACLAPEANRRAVGTASQQQVRLPIYRGSSTQWKRYAPFLRGAFDPLPRWCLRSVMPDAAAPHADSRP